MCIFVQQFPQIFQSSCHIKDTGQEDVRRWLVAATFLHLLDNVDTTASAMLLNRCCLSWRTEIK